ncbi:MAG: response regulator transcription factor [Desulfobacteraceae bacterium]|jgi:two-component system phosphate regulon response regulator PhoB
MKKITAEKKQILIIDDDPDILELLKYHLSNEGFKVTCVENGEKALKILKNRTPDLIVLDIMLPGVDGLEILKIVNNNPKTQNTPVIIVSAKTEETDVIIGIELGAADYVTKPFSIKVLIARVRALLRDFTSYDEDTSQYKEIQKAGEITLHPSQLKVSVRERSVELTPVEFSILSFLAKNPGLVFSRHQIADATHNDEYDVTERSVDVQIYGLRKKLGPARDCIETVWRVGYRLKA